MISSTNRDIELPAAETLAVLVKLEAALFALGAYGLAHTSRATIDQLDAITISLHNARLPRLERLIQSIRTQILEYQSKSPNFDPLEYSRVVAESGLISTGLKQKLNLKTASTESSKSLFLRELAGEPRSVYNEVGTLEVQCLAAEGWRSDAGYAGVTLYFFDINEGSCFTLTNVQPLLYGFNSMTIKNLYLNRSSVGGRYLSEISHGASTFLLAKVNRANRISSSSATKVWLKEQELGLNQPAFDKIRTTNWQELAENLECENEEEEVSIPRLRILEPAGYQKPSFDEISRKWRMEIYDVKSQMLQLEIENLPHTQPAIKKLENFFRRNILPDYLTCEVWAANNRLFARPISAGWKSGAFVTAGGLSQLAGLCHLNLEAGAPLESLFR